MTFLRKLNEILVEIGTSQETPFSTTLLQIEKPGKGHRCNILRNSYMKFDTIWCSGCREMASDGQTDVQTDGRIDQAATIRSLFREHKNTIIYEEQAWTNKPKDEQAQGRTDFGMNTAM